jgi:hypothetical protein
MFPRYAVLEVVEWKLVCSKFILEAGNHFYMEYESRKIFLSRDKLLSPNKRHHSGFIMVTRYAVLEVVEWKLVL